MKFKILIILLLCPGLAEAATKKTRRHTFTINHRAWLANADKDLKDTGNSGVHVIDKNVTGMNALVVKFSKYDVLFWDLIDNATKRSNTGYQLKYKFYF